MALTDGQKSGYYTRLLWAEKASFYLYGERPSLLYIYTAWFDFLFIAPVNIPIPDMQFSERFPHLLLVVPCGAQ